jgi:MFS family permease
MALFYVSADIPLGALADRTSRKRLIIWSLSAWSVLTALCGMTRSFGQLLLARDFVGIGAAGGTPPSQTLLSDRFSPQRRGLAMSLYAIRAAAGAALGASVEGWINDLYGWRRVLLVFGCMGPPFAALLALTVREPPRGQMDSAPLGDRPISVRETLRFFAGQPTLLHILAAATLVTFEAGDWYGGCLRFLSVCTG